MFLKYPLKKLFNIDKVLKFILLFLIKGKTKHLCGCTGQVLVIY